MHRFTIYFAAFEHAETESIDIDAENSYFAKAYFRLLFPTDVILGVYRIQ